MFKNIIVMKPGQSYVYGLTTSDLGKPDYDLLLTQHTAYIQALEQCEVSINVLPESEAFPDSTFVEDTAVLTPQFAILCNPGTESRNDEIKDIEPVLQEQYTKIHSINTPGYIDGGDVLQIENHFYVGISDRTNEDGANQFKAIVETNGYEATIIQLDKFFHLKTGISYLGNHTIVVAGEFIDHPAFKSFKKIIVPDEEEYAANCVRVNDYVIVPKGFPQTKTQIDNAGFQTIEVPMSEFQKHDGGLSCLSLRF